MSAGQDDDPGWLGPSPPVTAAATACALLVDEWVRAGLTDAVLSPGSRSTPLALALASEPRMRVHVHHDERSAGFVALGLSRATRRAAVVLTTSGTAAAELHPAVVEARHDAVALIVCTADRPPELRDVGAPQTIEQRGLFAPAVRWEFDPGVPTTETLITWRSLGARSVAEASGTVPGPVHLNLPFREPLVGSPGPLPPGRHGGRPWHVLAAGAGWQDSAAPGQAVVAEVESVLGSGPGVVVAGGGIEDPEPVLELARVLGWPVLADQRSGCRIPHATVVAHADALVRASACGEPAVVLRMGRSPASKVLAGWPATVGAREVLVDASGSWTDPGRTVDLVVPARPEVLARALLDAGRIRAADPGWVAAWVEADRRAAVAVDAVLGRFGSVTEPGVARALAAVLPSGSCLVVSSSMPVRDLEWYASPRDGLHVYANRGANGIDGVVSTAVGVALAGRPTALLIGDVAFLHDSNGLLGAQARGIDLVVVVVDNRGGGIFSFLPQAASVPGERFELLFGTPHDVDLVALARAHGACASSPETTGDLAEAMRAAIDSGGVHVLVVRTDRAENVVVHDEIHRAVAEAVRG